MISIYYTIFEPSHFPKFERAAVLRQIAWKQWELWTRWLLCIWVDDFLENFESAGWGVESLRGRQTHSGQECVCLLPKPNLYYETSGAPDMGKMNETTLQQ